MALSVELPWTGEHQGCGCGEAGLTGGMRPDTSICRLGWGWELGQQDGEGGSRDSDTRYRNPKCQRGEAQGGILGIWRNQPTHRNRWEWTGLLLQGEWGRVRRLVIAKGAREIVIGLEYMRCLEKRFLDSGYKKQSGVGRVVGDQEGGGRTSSSCRGGLTSQAEVQERSELKQEFLRGL